jgi:hypothetical protein
MVRADFVEFDDSNPSAVTVSANGFVGAPLTLNGSLVLTNNTYVNQSTTLPKGADITFVGSTPSFSTPYVFSTTYEFLSTASATAPLAELILNGTLGGPGEKFTGTFIGYGDANLPATVPTGTSVVVVGGGASSFTIGTGNNTTEFEVLTETPAAPLPSAAAGGLVLLCGAGVLTLARRRVAGA